MKNEKQIKRSFIGVLVKKYFVTGLIVVIPLWLTFFVVTVIFKWVSGFTLPVVNYFVADKYLAHIIVRILSFFISIMTIIILGFITNRVFGKNALNLVEKLIKKLPVLGSVYSAAKQFVSFIFEKDSTRSFKKVVFVPYPNKETYSVAFLTGEQTLNDEKYLCAFLPTTPNPTTGFLLLFKEKEIIYTDYTVEKAFQFVISVGVINMENNKEAECE
ncbi:MAG: DUF502 domain-containing protein [Endomicrobium sp.]|jgi:uncharacterized membrane protein|nr:DUF502 domain-containing protein [Endomicrobium sp.]